MEEIGLNENVAEKVCKYDHEPEYMPYRMGHTFYTTRSSQPWLISSLLLGLPASNTDSMTPQSSVSLNVS